MSVQPQTRAGLFAALLLTACSGGGSSGTCEGSGATCNGTLLTFCDKGTERKVTCKGPQGCMGNTCDSSTHTLGDGCYGASSQCDAVSGTRLLSCVSGQLRLFRTCSGPRQCFSENGKSGCDVTIGDSCPAAYNASFFCDSVDTQQVLLCSDGGIVLNSKCGGARNCAMGDGGSLICQ